MHCTLVSNCLFCYTHGDMDDLQNDAPLYASPKKSLGQNFLTNTAIVEKIVDAGEVTSRDCVIEIGPGRGILTHSLIAVAREVIAIEKDELLVMRLSFEFKKEIETKKLHLISSDALLFNPEKMLLQPGGYKVIANIPYYITGALIRKFLSEKTYPNTMVLMLQKEVARRIVARDKKESILSIAVKVYGTPIYVDTVKAGSFNPPPSVDSAILKIEHISKKNFSEKLSEESFFSILRAGFAQKRKKLSSNLSLLLPKEAVRDAFTIANLSDDTRAEDIPLETWLTLATLLSKTFTQKNSKV